MRDTDWEVDCDPTIVQLTDGLSCQEGIETDLGDTRAFGTHTMVWPTGRAGRQLPTTCKAPATQTPCSDIHLLARALPETERN